MPEALRLALRILPIVLLILLGMGMNRWQMIRQQTVDDLKKIVMNLSLPAMLFLSFARTTFSSQYLGVIAAVFLACLVMLGAALAITRRLRLDNPFIPALYAGFETGMIGYALFIAAFGQQEIAKLAIVDLGQVLFVFFVLVYYINLKSGIAVEGRQLLLSFAKTPVIVAILAGVALSLSGLAGWLEASPATSFLFDGLGLLGNLTVPLITIAIGYELRLNRETLRGPLLVAASRILILLLLASLLNRYLLVGWLGLNRMFEVALLTLFVLPPPFVIPILMRESQPAHRQFVLNTISIHILLTIIAFVGILVFVR
jgi:hypothetical protein